ncbi:class F sortase [Candidatus Nomurabacteria bacterium]|nr:class F sortase [Candidatus Nomurabacteria bacterium]
MQKIKKYFKKGKIFLVILATVSIFFLGITSFISIRTIKDGSSILAPSIVEAKTIKTKDRVILNLPVKLKIPSLKISSTIDPMGLTKDGAMDSPVGPSNTGWYKLGTIPGSVGSAVIDGHSGFKGGVAAVFDNLYKIKVGGRISVLDSNGTTTNFIVRKISRYDPNADATKVFTSTDGKAHLNLITCTGAWNSVLKSHNSRLVVFTDKE